MVELEATKRESCPKIVWQGLLTAMIGGEDSCSVNVPGMETMTGMRGIQSCILNSMPGPGASFCCTCLLLLKGVHPLRWMGMDVDGVEGCMANGGVMGMKGKICSGSVANGVGRVEGVMIGVMVGGGLIMEGLMIMDGNVGGVGCGSLLPHLGLRSRTIRVQGRQEIF
ncbi:hypothetical protein Taro_048085 [Colocasia esculenta]|uniref:Uncharacterized protein n=1 Tax=Colocasia esculenta TaxID=4460 RepID=A0A843X232_COLES|nr:hypothetical protein [Colocasia esculenta]